MSGDWPWVGLASDLGQAPPEVVATIATVDRALTTAGAQRAAEHDWGVLLRSQFTPDLRDGNLAVVTSRQADPQEVLRDVELAAREDGITHRRLRLDVRDQLPEVQEACAAAWGPSVVTTTRALMVAVAAPDRLVDTGQVGRRFADALVEPLAVARAAAGAAPRHVHQQGTRDKRILAAVSEAGALGVVAEDADGRLAGVATVRLLGPFAAIDDLFVLPEHRGAGHGRALLQEAMQTAVDGGAQAAFLTCDAEAWTWRLFARLGFATAHLATELTRPGPAAR